MHLWSTSVLSISMHTFFFESDTSVSVMHLTGLKLSQSCQKDSLLWNILLWFVVWYPLSNMSSVSQQLYRKYLFVGISCSQMTDLKSFLTFAAVLNFSVVKSYIFFPEHQPPFYFTQDTPTLEHANCSERKQNKMILIYIFNLYMHLQQRWTFSEILNT